MKKGSFSKFSSRVIGELVLIIVGVTVALWLENELENLKDRNIEKDYIESFDVDWHADIKELEQVIAFNKSLKSSTETLFSRIQSNTISDEDLPSELFIIMNYRYFTPQDFTLQSLKESGEFRLIQDREIRRKILRLQRQYRFINEAQDNYQHALDNYIVPLINENIDLAHGRLITVNFKNDHRLSNLVMYTINDVESRIALYQHSLDFLNTLTSKTTTK